MDIFKCKSNKDRSYSQFILQNYCLKQNGKANKISPPFGGLSLKRPPQGGENFETNTRNVYVC